MFVPLRRGGNDLFGVDHRVVCRGGLRCGLGVGEVRGGSFCVVVCSGLKADFGLRFSSWYRVTLFEMRSQTVSLTKMYGYVTTVAIAFDPTPIQKLSPTPSLSPSRLPESTADLIRSNTP